REDVALCPCRIWFFFQAEDGIRDFHVTGVQTCALPISMLASARKSGLRRSPTLRYSNSRKCSRVTAIATEPGANAGPDHDGLPNRKAGPCIHSGCRACTAAPHPLLDISHCATM